MDTEQAVLRDSRFEPYVAKPESRRDLPDILRDPASLKRPYLDDGICRHCLKWNHGSHDFTFEAPYTSKGEREITKADTVVAWNLYCIELAGRLDVPFEKIQ
ncbi:MAG TPA: hypothetical protein VLA12_15300 [Planctomycetaceae bacterium]|nr:hypothetical protein [Planctomycetaceae bacterium]